MACPLSEELRQQWKEKILDQRNSGLSMAAWCRRNKIAVYNLYYWQKKLFPNGPIDKPVFTEITTEKNPHISDVGFILECQGINVYLSDNFDPSVLKRCLKVLKEC